VFNLFINLLFGFIQALIVTRYTSPDTSDLTIPSLCTHCPRTNLNPLGLATPLDLTVLAYSLLTLYNPSGQGSQSIIPIIVLLVEAYSLFLTLFVSYNK
jgi:hypothetical protein